MKTNYTIHVMAGSHEMELQRFLGVFGLAKARAAERLEASIGADATRALVRDYVGRMVYSLPKSEGPRPTLR